MTTPSTSKRLTIFEGADGSGKTTAARRFAEETGAAYIHFGAFKGVTDIARFYAEAMLPAVLGHQDVVFDRSWYDEEPYGRVYRGGADRVGQVGSRLLARLGMRCGMLVVVCTPPWHLVRDTFLSRIGQEYLDCAEQLQQVYDHFASGLSTYPFTMRYDWTKDEDLSNEVLDRCRYPQHRLDVRSAGNLGASVVLVGEGFADHKQPDPFYQWPFASFSRTGCSWWLTEQLEAEGCHEHNLLWVNSDQPLEHLPHPQEKVFVALGERAEARLKALGYPHVRVTHPQHWKRFSFNKRYPLLDILKKEGVR